MPEGDHFHAYEDHPLPIGFGQTISQPSLVGLMTELLNLKKDHRVLEIGIGSGYQAAILSRLVGHVYTIEIVSELAHSAAQRLAKLGFLNITVAEGDGHSGYPEEAPFDRIILEENRRRPNHNSFCYSSELLADDNNAARTGQQRPAAAAQQAK